MEKTKYRTISNVLDSYAEIYQDICNAFDLTDEGLGGNITDCRGDDFWLVQDNQVVIGYGLTKDTMELFPPYGLIHNIKLSTCGHFVGILVENKLKEKDFMIFDRSKYLGGCDYIFEKN